MCVLAFSSLGFPSFRHQRPKALARIRGSSQEHQRDLIRSDSLRRSIMANCALSVMSELVRDLYLSAFVA